MKNKKVSLKDIAKEVGVSIATVSYVLSKGKDSKVSAEMSKKIKKVAKELNYQPNQIAKSLKSGRTYTIGLIVADISNPFFANLSRVIEDEATKYDYTLVFGSSDEKEDKSWKLIQFLANRQVDGFIIAPTEGSEYQINYLKEQNIPFVLVDRYFPEIPTNYVVIDNYDASYKAVERLVKTGNKKIGMVAYVNTLHHMRERVRGYQTVLKDYELDDGNTWLKQVKFAKIKEEIESSIDEMLDSDDPVSAIFFATNTLAIHGLRHIEKRKYKVPDDLAVVSFDEGEAFDFYYCPLTHVGQPLNEMGIKAVKILVDQIENKEAPAQSTYLDANLVIRESCGR